MLVAARGKKVQPRATQPVLLEFGSQQQNIRNTKSTRITRNIRNTKNTSCQTASCQIAKCPAGQQAPGISNDDDEDVYASYCVVADVHEHDDDGVDEDDDHDDEAAEGKGNGSDDDDDDADKPLARR